MKGHFDLVKALGDLKKNGAKFNLVGLIQGPEYNLRKLILLFKENNILDRTWLLPYIPHWHIGSFIKACTVICFLERDFSVTCHAPSVPTEVLFHGKCLLLSREIYEKFWLKNKLVDFKNIILTDPKNLNDLSEKLLYILKNPLAVEAINKAALDVVKIQMPTEIISNYLLGLFEQAKSNYQLSMIKKMVNDVENLFDGGFLFKVIKNLLYRSTLFKKLSKFSLKSKILQVFEDDLENVRDSSVINCFVAENYQNDLTQDQINELYLNYIKIQNPSMIDAKSIDKLYFEKVLAKSVVLWDTSRVVHENDKPIFIFYDSKNSKKTQEAFYKTLAGEIYLFRPMLKNYDSGVIKINDQTERLLKKCDGVNTIKKLFVDYDVSTVVDKILFVNMFQKLFSLGLIKF
ncbi:MAG: glycosyltransferase [Gammaproteobacteria bacterium]